MKGIENAFGNSKRKSGWDAAMTPPTDAEIRKNSWIPKLADIQTGIKKRRR